MTGATYKGISDLIASIGIPYAYYQFDNDTAKPTPFICFYYSGEGGVYGDNINYAKRVDLTIELYTDEKRFDLEQAIETLLNDNELPFVRYESYIDSEQMLLNSYETEVFING